MDSCQIGPTYAWPEMNWNAQAHPQGDGIAYGDDTTRGPHPIGFTFTFYGQDYTQFWTDSNGTMFFAQPARSTYTSVRLPAAGFPGVGIAAFWGDINAPNGRFKTIGNPGSRQLVYERQGQEYGNTTPVIYRVLLEEGSNEITVMMQNAQYTRTGHNLSIGLQASAQRGLSAIYQTAQNVTHYQQRALRFVPW
jgi:hypothetical protein